MKFNKFLLLSLSFFHMLLNAEESPSDKRLSDNTEWYEETSYSKWRQQLAIDSVLIEKKTPYQNVIIFKNNLYGKVFATDGTVQITETDEYIFNEIMSNIPMMSHACPKRILLIGGGDGCLLREILKHPSVETVDFVEMDKEVIDLCKTYMPDLCLDAFNDPRTRVIIDEATAFLKQQTNLYDVIFCNVLFSDDPQDASMALYSESFYKQCYDQLTEGGIFVSHDGVPFLQPDHFKDSYHTRKNVFDSTSYFYVGVPSLIGGLTAFGFSTKGLINMDQSLVDSRYQAIESKLRYYTPDLQKASFEAPKMFSELLGS